MSHAVLAKIIPQKFNPNVTFFLATQNFKPTTFPWLNLPRRVNSAYASSHPKAFISNVLCGAAVSVRSRPKVPTNVNLISDHRDRRDTVYVFLELELRKY